MRARDVVGALIGVLLVVTGLRALFTPEAAVRSSYRWDRLMARWLTFGRFEPSGPVMSDRTARRVMIIAGIVLVTVGAGVLVVALGSLLQ